MLIALLAVLGLQSTSTPLPAALFGGPPTVRRAVDVYILTGQSNALGTTNNEGLTPAEYGPGSHPADPITGLFWSNVKTTNTSYPPQLYGDSGGVTLPLSMQQGDGGGNRFFWGPEHGLARGLWEAAPNGGPVLIIKSCRGGGGNSIWDKAAFDLAPDSGHMWGHLRDTVDAALGTLQSGGHPFRVRGLVYLQGESNSPAEAAVAGARLAQLAAYLKSHIETLSPGSTQPMRVVVGEIGGSDANPTREMTTLAQMSAAASPSITFVRTADLPLKSDDLHFGREAKLAIGRRFADVFLGSAKPFSIGRYRADLGRPTSPADIESPLTSGFTLVDAGPGTLLGGVIDAGTPAWRVLDDSPVADAGYQRSITSLDLRGMFDAGWSFRSDVKVMSGGGIARWSVAAAQDPGWGVPSGQGSVTGFVVDRVGTDGLRVALWGDPIPPVSLGPGSANAFHTLELRGAPASPLYELFIDGSLIASGIDLTSSTDQDSLNDRIMFGSGQPTGVERDVLWAEVSLSSSF